MWKSWKGREYPWHKDLRGLDFVSAGGITLLFSYFFYGSFWAMPFMSLIGVGYLYLAMLEQKKKRLQRERDEFKECILSVSASLRAGHGVEGAFMESKQDMMMLYGINSYVVRELCVVEQGLKNREPMEMLLLEWGERSEMEVIGEFADVFAIGKRGGGNIPEIIEAASRMISQRLLLEEELETLLANKRLEQKVMNTMPFLVVFYLGWSNPGYFDMFYEDYVGRLLMTGCLAAYILSYWLSKNILRKIYD